MCRKCGGEAKVIARVEEQAVIDEILTHLQAQGALPPPPEWLPVARAPRDLDWFALPRVFGTATEGQLAGRRFG